MSRQSSTQAYTEAYTDQNIHVATSTERRQFPKYLYILFIFNVVFSKKFYFVVEPE